MASNLQAHASTSHQPAVQPSVIAPIITSLGTGHAMLIGAHAELVSGVAIACDGNVDDGGVDAWREEERERGGCEPFAGTCCEEGEGRR